VDGDRQITLTVRTDGKDQDRTLPLAKTLRIRIDEASATVADLRPGMSVWLKLAPDGSGVAKIMAKKSTP